MLFRTLSRNLISKTLKPTVRFTFCNNVEYQKPQSKLTEFTHYLSQMDDKQSLQKAAEMMGTLQADQEIYRQMEEQLDQHIHKFEQTQSGLVAILRKLRDLEHTIKATVSENMAIEKRCNEQLNKVKIYGISRIAKEIIEVADHLTQAIKILQKSEADPKEVKKIHGLNQDLMKVLLKYEIYSVDPMNQIFDPNEHYSVGAIDAPEESKVNMIAQTMRVGWKIRDRILRSPYVVIYK